MIKQGFWTDFEGIDGAGKTEQIERLVKYAKRKHAEGDIPQDTIETGEPWKGGKSYADIIKMQRTSADPYSHALEMLKLYTNNRSEHQKELIMLKWKDGKIIVSHRGGLSTYAYQTAQGIPFETIREMHQRMDIHNPDLTFWLDVDAKTAMERIRGRDPNGKQIEKFERNLDFLNEVSAEYSKLYEMSKHNKNLFGEVVRIDASKSMEEVAKEIKESFDYYRQHPPIWGMKSGH